MKRRPAPSNTKNAAGLSADERNMIKRLETVTGRKAAMRGGQPITSLKVAEATRSKSNLKTPDGPTALSAVIGADQPPQHKFRAQKTTVDNIEFDSKIEASRYEELKQLQRAGVVIGFLRQVPFHIGSDSTYRVDFQVFWADGNVTFEDTKGRETENFRLKMRLIQDLYPWATIHILKRR